MKYFFKASIFFDFIEILITGILNLSIFICPFLCVDRFYRRLTNNTSVSTISNRVPSTRPDFGHSTTALRITRRTCRSIRHWTMSTNRVRSATSKYPISIWRAIRKVSRRYCRGNRQRVWIYFCIILYNYCITIIYLDGLRTGSVILEKWV